MTGNKYKWKEISREVGFYKAPICLKHADIINIYGLMQPKGGGNSAWDVETRLMQLMGM